MMEVLFPIPSLTKGLTHFEVSPSLICEVFLGVVVVIRIPLVRREGNYVSDIFGAICFLSFELPSSGPLPMCGFWGSSTQKVLSKYLKQKVN